MNLDRRLRRVGQRFGRNAEGLSVRDMANDQRVAMIVAGTGLTPSQVEALMAEQRAAIAAEEETTPCDSSNA